MQRKLLTIPIIALLSFAPAAQAQQSVSKQAQQTVNVRSGPRVGYSDIGDLSKGQKIKVFGYDATGRWAMINWQGRIAYVSARYLTDPPSTLVDNKGTGWMRVTGIPANDPDGGLVVRAGPGVEFPKQFVVPQGVALNIVGISPNGKWSRAQFSDGGFGWVRNHYLTDAGNSNTGQSSIPAAGATLANGMPAGLNCLGTEPFWSFQINSDGTTKFTEANNQNFPIFGTVTAVSNTSYPYSFEAGQIQGVLENQSCSDGMSEITYPWALQLSAPINGFGQQLNGCCRMLGE